MPYLGKQKNDVVKNVGLYTPSEILRLTKDKQWGGSIELIAETLLTGSYVETVNFTDIRSDEFTVHMIIATNMQGNSATAQDSRIRVSTDGGSSYKSSNYMFAAQSGQSNGSFGVNNGTSEASMMVAGDLDNETLSKTNLVAYLYNAGSSSRYTNLSTQASLFQSAVNVRFRNGGSVYKVAETVNAIQFLTLSNGGFKNGHFRIFGLKE